MDYFTTGHRVFRVLICGDNYSLLFSFILCSENRAIMSPHGNYTLIPCHH